MPDRIRDALRTIVRGAQPTVDYFALHPATVLKDHGTHELDLQPDHPDLPLLVRVPLRLHLPGVTVKVKTGARVLLAFEDGAPEKPIAHVWQSGTLELIEIRTGLGHTIRVDDDRGATSLDSAYTAPKITVRDKAGNTLLLDATPGAERLELLDLAGSKVTLDPVATTILVSATGDVHVEAGGSINLAGGTAAVARVGDTVAGGVITSGSSKVFAG